MSVVPQSPPAAPRVKVAAGTTAQAAVNDAGLPAKGPQAVVVVRDPDGVLRDLAWLPTRMSRSRRSPPTPRTAGA